MSDQDWTFDEAWGINNLQQIVGIGTLGGQPRAFLLSPVQSAPRAQPDSVTTETDGQIMVDVLGNDESDRGLQVVRVGSPSNGDAELSADSRVLYRPNSGFSGIDRFAYTVADGQFGLATSYVSVRVETAVAEIETFRFTGHYPNPARGETNFEVALPEAADVRIEVFNILGQPVDVVVDQILPAGLQKIRYDTRSLAAGMYLYRISADEHHASGRLVVIR